MSRIVFHTEQERQILQEAFEHAIHRAELRGVAKVDAESCAGPLVVTDPRIVALLDLAQKAGREIEAPGKADSNMAQHYLEMLSVFASILAGDIRGNTRFHKKAA